MPPYGVIMYVNFIFIAIFIGYSIGSAPVVGYHHGAGNSTELKSLFRKSLLLVGAAGVALDCSRRGTGSSADKDIRGL